MASHLPRANWAPRLEAAAKPMFVSRRFTRMRRPARDGRARGMSTVSGGIINEDDFKIRKV